MTLILFESGEIDPNQVEPFRSLLDDIGKSIIKCISKLILQRIEMKMIK